MWTCAHCHHAVAQVRVGTEPTYNLGTFVNSSHPWLAYDQSAIVGLREERFLIYGPVSTSSHTSIPPYLPFLHSSFSVPSFPVLLSSSSTPPFLPFFVSILLQLRERKQRKNQGFLRTASETARTCCAHSHIELTEGSGNQKAKVRGQISVSTPGCTLLILKLKILFMANKNYKPPRQQCCGLASTPVPTFCVCSLRPSCLLLFPLLW